MCLDNFYVALKRLGSETECDETDTSTNYLEGEWM